MSRFTPGQLTLGQRREIKKIAKSRPTEHDLPFSTWSLAKPADFPVAEGVVEDISHEGLRTLLREEGASFQRVKIWKTSKDPRYAEKKACVEHLYAIAAVLPEPPWAVAVVEDAAGDGDAGPAEVAVVAHDRAV